MGATFKCQFCGRENEISEALVHQAEEKVRAEEIVKHQAELEKVRLEAESRASVRLKADFDLTFKQLQQSAAEEKERNATLQNQILAVTKELREAHRQKDELHLQMEKQLAVEEEKIRAEALKKSQEENELKFKEYEKKLADTQKALAEAERKSRQGSQQTQGEVLELELEELLKKNFPEDQVREVKKGQRGADVVQEVIDKRGKPCGLILWESKNAQWSQRWLAKLREDQRQAKAHLAVLLMSQPPEELKTFTYQDGVWLSARSLAVPLATSLRYALIRLQYEKTANVGKNEKAEVLFQYITSLEFKQRIEAIVEAFGNLQEEIEKEKRYFNVKWAREEKQLRQVLDHTHGMYGDLQGVVGKSLPEIKTLQLEPENEK